MKIEVVENSLQISHGENLKALSMVVHKGSEAGAALAATKAGFLLDDLHAMISIDYLRDAARPTEDPDAWSTEFEKMIAYADSRGWVQDGAVRVHISTRSMSS